MAYTAKAGVTSFVAKKRGVGGTATWEVQYFGTKIEM
jgi:hypothetical protein